MKQVILVGKGAEHEDLPRVLELGIPVLTSWQAIDLLDNDHPMNFGRPGIYGQRCANKILFHAESVIALGCRCSLWAVGYNFRPKELIMVDIDRLETDRYPFCVPHNVHAAQFIGTYHFEPSPVEWLTECNSYRANWIEGEPTFGTYINPYHFVNEINKMMREDQIIVTDTGTPYIVCHQVMKIRRPQRLIASGGLSEMGAGLPGAIGAAIASKRPVIMMSGDGGFMMNIQELATIAGKELPVKSIVFNNGGYNMIRRSQENLGYVPRGTAEPDLTIPSFCRVARGFDLPAVEVRSWDDFWRVVPWFMDYEGPALMELFTSPDQPLLKLNPSKNPDGTINSPEFWDLTMKAPA